MSYHFRIAAFMLLMLACCSGIVFSQIFDESGKEFNRALYQELQKSEDEMMQFELSLRPLLEDMDKNIQAKIEAANIDETSSSMTPEEMLKLELGINMDEMIGIQKPINDKMSDFFSEEGRQKMHLRLFQLKTGLMERLEATDGQEVVQMVSDLDHFSLLFGQPDFLELSPEQRELITKQHKDTALEAMALTAQATERAFTAERRAEFQQIEGELQKAETDEEREEITKKILATNSDLLKDIFKAIAPELKAIFIKGHEDFMRVLTDAQKAKIKAVMADMPDYLKNFLAEVDKGGDALSGLESWVPGMGAPGVNPNREAPRQRPSSERAFPGN